jgi:hypothetical protein
MDYIASFIDGHKLSLSIEKRAETIERLNGVMGSNMIN